MNNNEHLDNPLVVHNKNDASYQNSNEIEMNETLVIEETNTLKRHRFRKDKSKNKNNSGIIFLIIILVLVVAFCVLYFTGNFSFNNKNDEELNKQTTTQVESTTSFEQAYKGTIVIKDTYIFVDGYEVNGIEGMQDAISFLEPSTTAFVIINDGANDTFLNNEILPVLMKLGFYDEKTDIKHSSEPELVPSELAATEKENTSEAETVASAE